MLKVTQRIWSPAVVERTFESMDEQFLLVTVTVIEPTPRPMSPFHWLLADGRKPALDVSIDPVDGTFRELTHFIDAPLTPTRLEIKRFTQAIPRFETDQWAAEKDVYYVEQSGETRVHIRGNDLVLVFEGSRPEEEVDLTSHFGVLLDAEQRLAGLILKSLTTEEWGELRRSRLA